MIENERDFDCQMKHKQPISMVVLDHELQSNQRLLCQKCIDDFETQARVIGFKRVIQMIEDKRKVSLEIVGNVITQNIKNIELFQSQLFSLNSYLVQQLDHMICNTKDWISDLQSKNQKFSEYSFFQELDLIINNQISTQNDQINFSSQINDLNDAYYNKLNSKLEIFKSFQEYSNCKDILNNLSQQSQQQQYINSNPIVHNNINQNQKQNNQIINNTIIQQQQSPNKLQFIDNSIKQEEICNVIVFDQTGTIIISASRKDIKVQSFNNGFIKQTQLLQGHQDNINSKFNQWQSSQPYNQHSKNVLCIILTQKEDQLISGSEDRSIKVWMVDFNNNELKFLYSLDKHTSSVYSLSLNPSERELVSCEKYQIIIWKKQPNSQWKFQYIVNLSLQECGVHVKFLQEDQFIWLPEKSNQLRVFECKNGGQYQENIKKRVQFKKDNLDCVNMDWFPIIYNKAKNLICLRHVFHICILKGQNDGSLSIVEELNCQHWEIYGTVTNNGQYLVYWGQNTERYEIYKILYK